MTRRRRFLVTLVAGAVLTGFAVGQLLAPAATRRSPSATAHAREARRAAAPTDAERTEDGARSAAIAYATASQDWLYLTDTEIDQSVRAIATRTAAATLAGQTVSAIGTARDGLAPASSAVWWLVRPLATKVERFDPATSRVVVWTVTVLAAAGVALPQADWQRVAVDLDWEGGRWRVAAVDTAPGPTPAPGSKDQSWQADAFTDALEGFARVGSETAP